MARKTQKLESKEPDWRNEAERPAISLEPISGAIESFSRQFATTVEHLEAENQAENRHRRNYEADELRWTKRAARAGITFSIFSLILSGLTLWVLTRTLGVYRGQATIMATQAATMGNQTDIMKKTLPAMQAQAQAALVAAHIAQKQLEMSERPWVYADIGLVKPLTYNVNGANITIRFILHNVGHSPAATTSVNLQAYAAGAPNRASDPLVEQRKLCEPLRTYPPNPHAGGFTLFPNQTPTWEDATVDISRKEIADTELALEKRIGVRKPAKKFSFQPIIVGCIDYRFEFTSDHHQTGFIFFLSATKHGHPKAVVFELEAYQDYPIDQLVLDRMMDLFGGGEAD